ncbi:class I SAM-dependent methyltransferase [Chloroflexota bacterium]
MIDTEELSALLLSNVNLRVVEPHIYSVYPEGEQTNIYDKTGAIYDLVACNRLYNRFVWGYWIAEYASFCQDALTSSVDGWVLDVACGSLAFSARTYDRYSERSIVLLDQSVRLLQMVKSRLIKLHGSVPDNMVFLHGNALQLPFNPKSFKTVILLNLLHVLENVKRVLHELENVLADEGTIHLTTLIKNNRLADRYLDLLGRVGLVVPRNPDQLLAVFDELEISAKHYIKGNLMFINSS